MRSLNPTGLLLGKGTGGKGTGGKVRVAGLGHDNTAAPSVAEALRTEGGAATGNWHWDGLPPARGGGAVPGIGLTSKVWVCCNAWNIPGVGRLQEYIDILE